MANVTRLRLIQFRAGYNLPVHVGRERGIFDRHSLDIEIAYTPGSLYLSEALRKEEFEIGHTGADDVVAVKEVRVDQEHGWIAFMDTQGLVHGWYHPEEYLGVNINSQNT